MTGSSRKLAITSEFGLIAKVSTSQAGPAAAAASEISEEARLAAIAHAEYASRRRRDRLFNADLFAEPAWDMLLDLFVQRHKQRPVSIHSLCIAAAVPTTTAFRWIGKLEARGFICRRPCPHDNRVVHVTLSESGLEMMERYLRGQLGAIAATTGPSVSFN